MYTLGKNTAKHLESILQGGNPASQKLVDAVKDFINYTPIDFCILESGGFRTAEYQNGLYNQKPSVSKCDGYKHKSKHQSGLAVDLVPWVLGKPTWEKKYTFDLSGAFLTYCKIHGLKVTSGSDWNDDGVLTDGWDPCHMQIKGE